ncbi:MAG: hypothetical protein HETSPECPRED_002704 [Heterodermia speciosa]|uniref:Lysine-specific metallo-endopeptidase domain-containing protein n=1 Tax=Heterodermia speciosa TaxID=116794 RepID=A0A8H3IJJ2_9LECA|nr:MAG: hypothetical protein HETSPECPRED_002704 [Heterodermia speciosa]
MHQGVIFPVLSFALFLPAFCLPAQSTDAALQARNVLAKRTNPDTGDDLPDSDDHPNHLDQVETAFNDALELASYVLDNIDKDTTIFPNYFDEGDRAGVKNVYAAILGTTSIPENPTTGNDLLGNLLVQTTDTDGLCTDQELAYSNDEDPENPFIVLCPNAFKKKAVTSLNGAENPADNPDDAKHYILCDDLKINGHVSYLMNSLGSTLLHEYTHYDGLVESIFGAPIIDQDNGYGPVNVYNNLDKGLSPFNADSYMYYALHTLWNELCSFEFDPPRAGTDDADPDCGNTVCRN